MYLNDYDTRAFLEMQENIFESFSKLGRSEAECDQQSWMIL